ncbi:SRPBCC domain-containing protein [Glutamicibacter sp. MNS18]|uniref:SRPBCC family protein n=1 Tax=Glutamicibacter sp. MNS18 TaxID=2989817 RepID=UPI00223691CC|nr:SRPBCC domain-containing protein [Glutamicibacter sp. MNS18]MCW4464690.1 SRPBCC domain-containing protein [Glutamicibacter sp. MNS18]
MSYALQLQARMAAAPAAVYRALTNTTALETWFAENADVSLPEQRFEFWGRHTPQGERGHHALLTATPGKLLRFSWKLDGQRTIVEIRLVPDGEDHTILRLHQDGLPTLEEMLSPTGRRDGLHTMHTFWGLALANLAEYFDGRALTPKADFRASRSDEIRVSLEIAASPEAVFASLVDPEQVKDWFGWEIEIEPRLEGKITLGADGKIFEFESAQRLAYSEPDGSVVRWELEGSDAKTYLTFVQTGYADDEWDSAAQHEAGWLGSLAELKRMHELGKDWMPLITERPSGDEPNSETDRRRQDRTDLP